jgi:hypothetical protein
MSAARSTEASTLVRLQRGLERLYDLPAAQAVLDFLITDAERARALERAAEPPARERVLVREAGDALELGVYLDESIVARLDAAPPSADRVALDDLWDALEGVSHFTCLAWHARHARPVSRLELELQAEVDKYVTTAALAARDAAGRVPRWLHADLFGRAEVDPRLDPETAARYRAAFLYAARYCRALERRYFRTRAAGLATELRRFYRMERGAKLRFIESVA